MDLIEHCKIYVYVVIIAFLIGGIVLLYGMTNVVSNDLDQVNASLDRSPPVTRTVIQQGHHYDLICVGDSRIRRADR